LGHPDAFASAGLATEVVDPKFHTPPNSRWPVYIAAEEDRDAIEIQLRTQMRPADLAKIEILALPCDSAPLREPGLLYLPQPCVVPGGRFNEMYAWDKPH
jgi:alpha,alpha-trehalase